MAGPAPYTLAVVGAASRSEQACRQQVFSAAARCWACQPLAEWCVHSSVCHAVCQSCTFVRYVGVIVGARRRWGRVLCIWEVVGQVLLFRVLFGLSVCLFGRLGQVLFFHRTCSASNASASLLACSVAAAAETAEQHV
jgi:hypothetical protein